MSKILEYKYSYIIQTINRDLSIEMNSCKLIFKCCFKIDHKRPILNKYEIACNKYINCAYVLEQ